jgi:hypothetical protein
MFDKPEPPYVRRIFMLFLCLPFYFNSFANNGVPKETGTGINWISIWLSFFFGVLFTILFRFLNKNSKTIDQRTDAGLPMSGWIIFLGVNLILRIVIQIYFFWKANYFLKSTWIHLQQAGDVKFHSLFIFEMFLSLFALTGTGALIYWFFGRRDIFPSMFIYYVGFYLAATLVLLITYHNMTLPTDLVSIRRNSLIQLLRIIYAAAWAAFVLKSLQVRKTFVYPR